MDWQGSATPVDNGQIWPQLIHHNKYDSGTPPNSSHLAYEATWHGPNWSTINTILKNAHNMETLLFRKTDSFLGPSSTWTVQNSLDNEDAGMPLMQVCLTWLIDSTTGHYNSIGTHSTGLLVSLSLASIQQMRALERGFIALIGTSTHCHTYQKYTESLQSNYLGRFRWHKWCPH